MNFQFCCFFLKTPVILPFFKSFLGWCSLHGLSEGVLGSKLIDEVSGSSIDKC